ncbi:MAG: NTP transferase domain-containing protein [Candidatus Omnitrophica bacterium]|nr:NTP transferase domain-containing protein [Candidatus Omnitrophota bacterium]MBU1047134.1 NTP transferase domain-containing protein [Candidatus Omnitrophota bacterium]MBU1766563.1 NTP transferase domain-containing protein [Candidatus Omnitrophota bacterium]MBU1889588.1 NTP transferase domain-containing protein [Candidatus Omnitrophota bacterium]
MDSENKINSLIKKYSTDFDYKIPRISIILAAGHGKRIKSSTSKVLYEIWGIPSVNRVLESAEKGISSPNQVIVVGVKAKEVIKAVGRRKNTQFVYQSQQNGTGDAVKTALEVINKNFKGDIYIYPADAGLITEEIIKDFRKQFENSQCDMMVLTGEYIGDPVKNHYGRIIKEKQDSVLEIKEYKDIVALKDAYKIVHNGKALSFRKEKLLKIEEFNSGIYAFKIKPFRNHISELKSNNIQKEYYLTDMVKIFNKYNLKTGSQMVENSNFLMGYNDRATLEKMENIARQRVYEQLKEIVIFRDPEDFFIAEEVVSCLLEMDRKGILVDLQIGKGAYLGRGVILDRNVTIGKNSYLEGDINIQEGVKIKEGVKIIGDDKYPVKIGKNVNIKGTSYIFGCIIDSSVSIEHCILIKKHIQKKLSKSGEIKTLRYIFPKEEGVDCLKQL